jgi:uncharacterized protein
VWWLWLLIFCLVLLFIAASAQAQSDTGYPDYLNTYVTDYADVINADTEAAITQVLHDLRNETGVEMAVITLIRRADYGKASETMPVFATGTFNAWGVGDKNRNNGVLMVVAIGDREAFIAVGSAYENTLNAKMQTVFDEFMRPLFRASNYDEGIYAGVRATLYYLTDAWVAAYADRSTIPVTFSSPPSNQAFSGGTIPFPTVAVNSDTASHSGTNTSNSFSASDDFYVSVDPEFGIAAASAGGLGLLGAAGVAWRRYQRYRPRVCPHCGHAMQRLDEHADDAFLDTGQKLEEVLGSIDYDIWQCPSCTTHQMFDYKNHFSGHSPCPQCNYRTVTKTTRTVIPPSYVSTGMREVTSTCNQCSYRNVQEQVIPKLERSSSSSGSSRSSSRGSFGGGKSSGGGGGGSW